MPCAWSGTIGDLKQLKRNARLEAELEQGFTAVYHQPTEAVLSTMATSLSALLNLLEEPRFDALQTLIELQMPVGAERADVVLLGGFADEPRGFVVELKQWSRGQVNPTTLDVDVPDYGLHQHPSLQALNYQGKLHLFQARAGSYDLRSAVHLPNMGNATLEDWRKNSPSDLLSKAPLFGAADSSLLARTIASHLLPARLSPNEHQVFRDAPYEQTRHLFDVIQDHGQDIARNMEMVLAEAGVGLTEEQDRLADEILAAARHRKPTTFVVDGGPGSGKTLLAVTLLLRAMQQEMRCTLAIRNNRLQAILRKCFDTGFPGASGTLVFFEVPSNGTGIGDPRFTGAWDLLICDEAQRIKLASIPTALRRAPVAAVFLDETQRLNPPDQGTISAFTTASRDLGRLAEQRCLTAAVRCRGGQAYHDWVETLLRSPSEANERIRPWHQIYRFEVCGSMREMLHELEDLLSSKAAERVALVGAFTESPGDMSDPDGPKNLRVGYPLASGFDLYRNTDLHLTWLMSPGDYVRFWLHRNSNRLDRVASIYGSQGFESDYVGIVWGRDLVIRNGRWTTGDSNVCYDAIEGLVNRQGKKRWHKDALDLLRNRYRIFLTRGILGTLISCEDEETRSYLSRIHGSE